LAPRPKAPPVTPKPSFPVTELDPKAYEFWPATPPPPLRPPPPFEAD